MRLQIAVAASITAFWLSAASADDATGHVIELMKRSTVLVKVSFAAGYPQLATGIVVARDVNSQYILTARHAVYQMGVLPGSGAPAGRYIKVSWADELHYPSFEAQIVKEDESGRDLALLKIPASPALPVSCLLKSGSPGQAYVFSFVMSQAAQDKIVATAAPANLTAFLDSDIEVRPTVVGGESGAPIVDPMNGFIYGVALSTKGAVTSVGRSGTSIQNFLSSASVSATMRTSLKDSPIGCNGL